MLSPARAPQSNPLCRPSGLTRLAGAIVLGLALSAAGALAQTQSAEDLKGYPPENTAAALPNAPDAQNEPPTLVGTPKRVVLDFYHLLQFPAHVHGSDTRWLVPLTAATVASFALDEHTMQHVVTHDTSFNDTSGTVSDGLRYGFIAVPALMYGTGLAKRNEHMRETGLLSGEAMIDANIAGGLLKLASFRERPNVDNYEGSFFRTSAGYNSSFVSGHAITAWSSAAVIASEYPSKWVQISAYTAATGVSLTRVLAQQHFPSDVLLGSAAGWLIGRYVYRHHAVANKRMLAARATSSDR